MSNGPIRGGFTIKNGVFSTTNDKIEKMMVTMSMYETTIRLLQDKVERQERAEEDLRYKMARMADAIHDANMANIEVDSQVRNVRCRLREVMRLHDFEEIRAYVPPEVLDPEYPDDNPCISDSLTELFFSMD